MTFTLFLLGALYVALVVALLVSGVNGAMVAIIAGGLAAVNLFASDKLALAAMGARVVTPEQAPQLHAMIDRLCVQADLPKPKVAVAQTSMPNAFALGRSPKSATVCATTGIMELLSPAELEGVMAHELTHVQNRDVLVMTLAGFFATIAAYIVQFGFFFGGGSNYGDDDDNPSFMVLFLVSLAVYVDLVLPDAGALALPRVRGRPRRGADHGPPERARLGAGEDLRRHAADPAAGPAHGGRAAGVLHLPRRRRQVDRRPLLHAPADGEADRRPAAPRGAAPGHRVAFAPMGFLDVLRGKRQIKQAVPTDRVFAMTTAQVTLEMQLGLTSTGKAAICFQPLATADFEQIVRDMEEVVRSSGEETGTTIETSDDEFGYRWMVLVDPDFEDLVVGINAVSTALEAGGYGDRILAAVFPFRDQAVASPCTGSTTTSAARSTRSCPAGGGQQRDSERELRLKAQIGAELPIEPELERWFPLWGIPV